MNYYQVDFAEHAAEEGDRWAANSRRMCSSCGRTVVPFANMFPVPDDMVERVDAVIWGGVRDALLYCAGILLARSDLAEALEGSALTGFAFREATVHDMDEDGAPTPLPPYRWLVINGRCTTSDVWRRVTGVCDSCRVAFTEPAENPTRIPRIRETHPRHVDICRGREDASGVLVSARFRDFLLEHHPEAAGRIAFRPVSADAAQG